MISQSSKSWLKHKIRFVYPLFILTKRYASCITKMTARASIFIFSVHANHIAAKRQRYGRRT